MRALPLILVLMPGLLPAQNLPAQTRARKTIAVGAVRTVPSGTRFALGTRTGLVSVETRGAAFIRAGRPAKVSDLALGSSLTIYGALSSPANGGRATLVATRIEIAPPPVAGTARRARLSKEGR